MRTILAISDSDKHFDGAIQEYVKRLGKGVKIEQIKPTRNGTHQQIIQKDTENIISLLQKKYSDCFKVLLTKEGKAWTTEEFSAFLKKNLNVVFVIGGPYGFDENKLKGVSQLAGMSFGQMTLQHGLAKLVLLEQLYRVSMIWNGKSYHY